ncbi:gamma carbonic anhydrase family protein [Aneurinibacillus sp. Ricciae_BoGa-3]|uniref:gamma carbonic anhydrase family protein n=1 Tax=Aneurinibacillus sp. Ricciae_BoGa-3 TaxID=3022697 RepID=UPI002340D468|nr:gamma carbonic anhydrase family protein [Aneurinibacillus sp. Ricciae_BoGa-3]WCK52410.1 gamma carbonic anhydrase family protein [Aneurinibacillus sp. Ricciae_BoGa-3]
MLCKYNGHYPKVDDSVYIAPGAKLIGNVAIGSQSSIWFNCVLRGDNAPITIGDKTNIQDGTICHVDEGVPLTVGDEVTVGHQVILHGCTIGKGALIGMGSIIMNQADIGEYALVAAGSLVPEGKKVPPYTLVMGSPAKVIRKLTEEDVERMKQGSQHYVANGKKFLDESIID